MGKIEKIEKYAAKGKMDKLTVLAHDPEKTIRIAVAEKLANMTENATALNILVQMVRDQDADVRKAAVTALGKGSGSYVVTQLQYCLAHEQEEEVLKAAKNSLDILRSSGN
ncbi:MAG: HEAT repeat domain-containing protein [Clostridiales bacterium]|nr:HEAT repeat domain-containing protein [Clostridiales bacterium]